MLDRHLPNPLPVEQHIRAQANVCPAAADSRVWICCKIDGRYRMSDQACSGTGFWLLTNSESDPLIPLISFSPVTFVRQFCKQICTGSSSAKHWRIQRAGDGVSRTKVPSANEIYESLSFPRIERKLNIFYCERLVNNCITHILKRKLISFWI